MNSEQIQEMKRRAEAATPGPWAYQEDSDVYTHIVRPVASPGWIIASATQTSKPEGEANGRFIAAANPAAVLELIAIAERATPAAASAGEAGTIDTPDDGRFYRAALDYRTATTICASAKFQALVAVAEQHTAAAVAEAGKRIQSLERSLENRNGEIQTQNFAIRTMSDTIKRLEAERAATAPVSAVPAGWRDALRRSKADTDYHGLAAFTPAQLESFVSLIAPPSAGAPTLMAYVATDLDGRFDVGRTPDEAKKRAGHGCDTLIPIYDIGLSAAAPVSAVPAFPPRDLAKPAEQQGIFEKFQVLRTDGSSAPGGKHHGCAYFVLDLDHDQHAQAAILAYAAACRATHPALADDIERRFAAQSAGAPVSAADLPAWKIGYEANPNAMPADGQELPALTEKEIAEIASNYFADGWTQVKAEAAISDAMLAIAVKQAGKEAS